jgi:hypothetical protein
MQVVASDKVLGDLENGRTNENSVQSGDKKL